MGVEKGAGVWVPDKKFGWRSGEIVSTTDEGTQVKLDAVLDDITEEVIDPSPSELYLIPPQEDINFRNQDPENGAGVDDMTTLNYLHEPAIQHNIRQRFIVKKPYTYTGKICIAVNPYMWLPNLYGEGQMAKYCNRDIEENPPHVYAVAELAYRAMRMKRQNQSILVSGESGAGKTETTKIVMGFLGHVFDFDGAKVDSDNTNDIDLDLTVERVLQSNPVLETFGNAKTLRNNNSSRFGKWIEMQFDDSGRLVGAKIRTYLLEKSRVVGLAAGERSYHSFYQLLSGSTEAERAHYGFGKRTAKDFRYLQQSNCYTADGIDDVKEYAITCKALQMVGVSEENRRTVWNVIAAVLNLGEVDFENEPNTEFGVVKDIENGPIANVARLLQVDKATLAASLCQVTLVLRKETTIKRLNAEQSSDARHALSKALYAAVFNYLVDTININIQNDTECKSFVGILDIFGFEYFQNNSFEQFCINFANEKLQQQFTRDTFKSVQDEYTDEGIEWSYVDFQDNQKCLDLMERGACVLSILNEECMVNGTDASFVHKMHTVFRSHKHFAIDKKQKELFGIVHYAAKVMYNSNGFLEKNRDPLSDDILSALRSSTSPLIRDSLFPQQEIIAASDGPRKKALNTVGTQFKSQLDSLMATIGTTDVNYIRCIKPNNVFASNQFDMLSVLNQLRYSGVLEAVRISRASYPNRQSLIDFVTRFRSLLPNAAAKAAVADPALASRDKIKEAVVKICSAVPGFDPQDKKLFQLGKTKVYFGLGFLESLEEQRTKVLTRAITVLQKHSRSMVCGFFFQTLRRESIKLQTQTRRKQQQTAYMHTRKCIITLQGAARQNQARAVRQTLHENSAALKIQKLFRTHQNATQYQQMLRRTTLLQKNMRARMQRLAYKEQKEEHKRQQQVEYKMQKLQEMLEAERRRREEAEAAAAANANTTTTTTVVTVAAPSPDESDWLKGAKETIDSLQAQLAEERQKNKLLSSQRKEAEERAAKAEQQVQTMAAKMDMGARNRVSGGPQADPEEVNKLKRNLKEANKKNNKLEEVLQDVLKKRAEEDELRLRLQKQVIELKDENGLLHEQLHMLKDIMREERTKYSKVLRLLQLQAQGVELPANILNRLSLASQPTKQKREGEGASAAPSTPQNQNMQQRRGGSRTQGGGPQHQQQKPQPRTQLPGAAHDPSARDGGSRVQPNQQDDPGLLKKGAKFAWGFLSSS